MEVSLSRSSFQQTLKPFIEKAFAMSTQLFNVINYSAQPVTLFSKNYLPMTHIDLKRAAVLLVTGRAEPLDFAEQFWMMRYSGGVALPKPSIVLTVPEHIRLTVGGQERLWKVPPVNRREVLKRDEHSCQYCGSKRNLTLDRVLPMSKGGQHTWENVVVACLPCNSKKGLQILQHTNLKLRRKPKAPMNPAIAFAEQF